MISYCMYWIAIATETSVSLKYVKLTPDKIFTPLQIIDVLKIYLFLRCGRLPTRLYFEFTAVTTGTSVK